MRRNYCRRCCRLSSRCVDTQQAASNVVALGMPTMRSWAALGLVSFVRFGVLRGGFGYAFASSSKFRGPLAARRLSSNTRYAMSRTAAKMASPFDPFGADPLLGDAMTADGRLVFRHVVVRAVELAIRSGAAGATQYFKPGGQAWAPLAANRALAKGQPPALPSAGSNRITHGANKDATCMWRSALAIAYCLLIPLWVVPLYGTFWMAAGSVSGCKNKYDYFYCWTCIYWVWLTLPALICSTSGLAQGYSARWLQLLPVCTFGVALTAFNIGHAGRVPPQVVVAGIVSSFGAILFSGTRGMLVGGLCLCLILVLGLYL